MVAARVDREEGVVHHRGGNRARLETTVIIVGANGHRQRRPRRDLALSQAMPQASDVKKVVEHVGSPLKEVALRDGLTGAQYQRVGEMMAALSQQGRNNMLVGLMAYMADVMGDIAVLPRDHLCEEDRSSASGVRREGRDRTPRPTGPADDEIMIEVEEEDPEPDGEPDTDDTNLMQTGRSNRVWGMLLETFAVALQKIRDEDRPHVAAEMLGWLHDEYGGRLRRRRPEGGVVAKEQRSWLQHWWNLLQPHLAGSSRSTSSHEDGPLLVDSLGSHEGRSEGCQSTFGITEDDMLHMAREAEEEMTHLRRVNTRYPDEPSDVVDARVEAGSDGSTQFVLLGRRGTKPGARHQ